MATEVERRKHHAARHPASDHGLDLDAPAFRTFHPNVAAVSNTAVIRVGRIDLGKHVLLQLGQPGVGAGLFTATLVFDQASTGMNQRIVF